MNYLVKSVSSLARCYLRNNQGNASNLLQHYFNSNSAGNVNLVRHISNSYSGGTLWTAAKLQITPIITKSNKVQGFQDSRSEKVIRKLEDVSLYRMHARGPPVRRKKKPRPLDGNPFLKGVVLKTLIKKPKKPNSANRKCVLVRLSNGKEMVAYIPGIGHNLQEHNIVLVRVGKVNDLPGVKIKCVRGKYDLPHVIKK